MALRHWEVARLTSVCEDYKRDLCQTKAIPPTIKQNKFDAIHELLLILKDQSTHSDDKVPAFTKQYKKHKSALVSSNVELGRGLHTPKLFKPEQKNKRIFSFTTDVAHIF